MVAPSRPWRLVRRGPSSASKTLRAPLVNAVRVAGPPKDHEADAYRASLLRCCASVFLEGSPGPFSLAPEADVLEGDDRADGGVVTLYRGVAAADEALLLAPFAEARDLAARTTAASVEKMPLRVRAVAWLPWALPALRSSSGMWMRERVRVRGTGLTLLCGTASLC